MDSKLTQKGWMSVILWLGLLVGTGFTSAVTLGLSVFPINIGVFSLLFQYFGNFTALDALLKDYSALFILFLGLILIFLLISAWLYLVSFTFEVSNLVFGDDDEEDDDEDSGLFSLPGQITRYLGFAWGIIFIFFLIIPLVSMA